MFGALPCSPTRRSPAGVGPAPFRNHPLVPGRIPIYGYIYDVATGRLVEVPEASQAGAASADE